MVLADAGYGDETAFRDGVTALGLPYAVGIRLGSTVWAPGHEPIAVKTLALSLDESHWHTAQWRQGTQGEPLSGRFAAVRVRPAHRDTHLTKVRPQEWLLIEWPAGQPEPINYFLSTAPPGATLEQLVFVTQMRWRIERDDQELKQDFGLGHYEGLGWRGFHHHATLSIAAYAFLMAQRLQLSPMDPLCQNHCDAAEEEKKSANARCLPFPQITSLADAPRAQRHVPDSIRTVRLRLSAALARTLGHCPHCGMMNQKLTL